LEGREKPKRDKKKTIPDREGSDFFGRKRGRDAGQVTRKTIGGVVW